MHVCSVAAQAAARSPQEGRRRSACWLPRYVPYVGDSKRAMDEYTSEIFMGGRNTIAVHNTCEDSLLAAPIILDLVLLAELLGRIQFGKVPPGNAVPGLHTHTCIQAFLDLNFLAELPSRQDANGLLPPCPC